MECEFSIDVKCLLCVLCETFAPLAGNNLPQRPQRARGGRKGASRLLKSFRFRSIKIQNHLVYPLIAFLSSTISLSAQQRYEFSHPQMGTVFRLVFYTEKDSATAQSIAAHIFARVDTLNAIFSDYLPESELNRLSDKAGSGEKVPVSKELWSILSQAKRYAKASDGAFDPTVGALTRLWRRARNLKEPPDSVRIAAALKTVDYRAMRLYKNRRVQLKIKGTRLDLGGIAQGYAADECLAMLKAAGIANALADAGGDIALGDAPPGAKGWAIERPLIDSTTETLFLANCGITTSGATYRYFEAANGVRYSHIVDPRTGWGIAQQRLVTVLARDAVTADAWATAVSVSGKIPDNLKGKRANLQVWR